MPKQTDVGKNCTRNYNFCRCNTKRNCRCILICAVLRSLQNCAFCCETRQNRGDMFSLIFLTTKRPRKHWDSDVNKSAEIQPNNRIAKEIYCSQEINSLDASNYQAWFQLQWTETKKFILNNTIDRLKTYRNRNVQKNLKQIKGGFPKKVIISLIQIEAGSTNNTLWNSKPASACIRSYKMAKEQNNFKTLRQPYVNLEQSVIIPIGYFCVMAVKFQAVPL